MSKAGEQGKSGLAARFQREQQAELLGDMWAGGHLLSAEIEAKVRRVCSCRGS